MDEFFNVPDLNGNLTTCGIRNTGCSCYLNCFLQIITNFSPIFPQLKKFEPQNELETHLCAVIQDLIQSEKPTLIIPFVRQIGSQFHFDISTQQNFFDILTDLSKNIPLISDLFNFDLDITYFKKRSSEEYLSIQENRLFLINLSESNVLKPGLSEIFDTEIVKYDDQICKKVKKLSTLPQILAFSFEYRLGQKSSFNFDTNINIKNFCNNENQDFSYTLYAILVHIGPNLQGGHYIVYIHNLENDQWIKYNDSRVRIVESLKKIKEINKYSLISGLFYIKQSIYDEFPRKKQKYEKARNSFIQKSFIVTNKNVEENFFHISQADSDSSTSDESISYDSDDDITYDPDNELPNIDLSEEEDIVCIDEDNSQNTEKVSIKLNDRTETFHHGAIDYVDDRPHGNLNKYLNEAPVIPNDQDQRPNHVQIDLTDEYFQKVFEANKCDKQKKLITKPVKKPTKRLYVKTTQSQRDMLQKLYNTHQDSWTTQQYSVETGIREKNCERLIKKIKCNQSLELKDHERGRKPKIDAKKIRLLESTLDENPYTTLNELKQKLKEETNTEVSKTQIWEGIVGNTKVSQKNECYIYSFKMASKRDPQSNTLENKRVRKDKVKDLSQCLVEGYEWVCVDETRFDVGYVRTKGWSKKGKRVFIHRKKRGFSCSGLTAIGHNGMLYCTLVRGKVTAEIYDAFLDHLSNELKSDGPIVFWMDNARIHEHAQEKFQNSKNRVIFNAPYSPEMNPIENIFGIWKEKIMKEIVKFHSEAELLDLIKETFKKIDPSVVRKTLEETRWNVFPKVMNLEDI